MKKNCFKYQLSPEFKQSELQTLSETQSQQSGTPL